MRMHPGKTTTMNRPIVLSCLALLMAQTAYAQLYNSTALTPPVGNSPKTIVKTLDAFQIYKCENGAWVYGNAYAALVDTITGTLAGSYTFTTNTTYDEVRSWTLINSAGDRDESGDRTSSVTGAILASFGVGNATKLPEMLFEAESHANNGAAASVSYIQLYDTEGGGPPIQQTCMDFVSVPFKANFALWRQNPLPAFVPTQLIPPGQLVEGFYGKGYIAYIYNGSEWVESGREGTLFTLPGSPVVGEFWEKGAVQRWEIYNPNGFLLYGKSSGSGVQVSKSSCPWALSSVTSQPTSTWALGPCTHVLTTSTRGGLPPITSYQPLQGAMMNVTFSAIYWFYINVPVGMVSY